LATIHGPGVKLHIFIERSPQKRAKRKVNHMKRTQTTDRNYRPEDYNQGLSVNGNLDKFNYYAS
jgi:vitamin B12 transporter